MAIVSSWTPSNLNKNLPEAFGDYTTTADKRAIFGLGTLEINNVLNFNDGLGVSKYKNVNADGSTPYSPNGVLVSIDFPLFRLGEMYLIYIEAAKRGGGGSEGQALDYFNTLRMRAYGDNTGNVTTFTLDDVLQERQRELYWECCRRTDLIRYNYYTSGSYLWPWKAGQATGSGADKHYELFPIPASDVQVNTNLIQNPGY